MAATECGRTSPGSIDNARERVGLAAGIPVERIEEDGPPADVIVRVAEREGADLIVVGSRGIGQAPRLLGSTSEAVLAHARLPTVVVPAPDAEDDGVARIALTVG